MLSRFRDGQFFPVFQLQFNTFSLTSSAGRQTFSEFENCLTGGVFRQNANLCQSYTKS